MQPFIQLNDPIVEEFTITILQLAWTVSWTRKSTTLFNRAFWKNTFAFRTNPVS